MTYQATTHLVSATMLVALRRLQWAASVIVIMIGAFVLFAWLYQPAWSQILVAGPYTMKPNTALALILAGLALGLLQEPVRQVQRRIAQLAASVVLLLSLLTLVQYLVDWNLKIDGFLLSQKAYFALGSFSTIFVVDFPLRMAMNTAFCFLLLSGALLSLDQRTRWGRPTEWLTVCAGFVTLTALITYIYDVTDLLDPSDFMRMALTTALSLGVLCWGILAARPQRGMMAYFWSSGPQGIVARRMAFGGTLSLLLMSVLIRWGQRLELYEHYIESSLLLSLGILIFALLVYQSMRALARLEEQRQASFAAFQEQYALLQGIINSTHDGIYVRDLQGYYRLVNENGATLVNMTATAMLGKRYDELFPEPVAAMMASEDQAVLEANRAYVNELTSGAADQRKVLHSVKTPYRDFAGNVIGILNVVRDITERKQVEERLQAAQKEQAELLALIEALLDNAPIGFAFFDRELRFVRVNQQWTQLIHLPMAAHLGQGLSAILPQSVSTLAPLIEQVFITGQGVYHQPLHVTNPAMPTDVRHMLVSWYPVVVDETGVRFVGAAVVDVTELRRAEAELRLLNSTLEKRITERTAELERSNRELDQFAYVASHDLKAPLRAIMNLSNWIMEDANALLPPPSQEHLTKLRSRSLRMERLLDDLLTYSRIGRRDGGEEEVSVAALLQDTIDLLAPPAGFQVTLKTALPTIRTQRAPLELVFRNLIGNAIKHHHQPAQGEVQISAQTQANVVEFWVSDNGPGIDPQYHERIFGLFQTLQPRDLVEGSGMGLALVKKTIEYRGGTVNIQSTPAQGATFHFTWPQNLSTQASLGLA